jgi:hypothetical protein
MDKLYNNDTYWEVIGDLFPNDTRVVKLNVTTPINDTCIVLKQNATKEFTKEEVKDLKEQSNWPPFVLE